MQKWRLLALEASSMRNADRFHGDPHVSPHGDHLAASGLHGRRLSTFKKEFPRHRARLLARLDCHVLLGQVPAWQRLEQCIRAALRTLNTGSTQS
jgi:hypothetical protein